MNITSLCGKSMEHAFFLHKESFSVINGAVSPFVKGHLPDVKKETEAQTRSGSGMANKLRVLKNYT